MLSLTYRYSYSRLGKMSDPMELHFATKVLPKLVQWLKAHFIPRGQREYKLEVLDKPGERGFWLTLPKDLGYIAVETGYEVTDAGMVDIRTDLNGLEKSLKLTGNASTDAFAIERVLGKIADSYDL